MDYWGSWLAVAGMALAVWLGHQGLKAPVKSRPARPLVAGGDPAEPADLPVD